MNGIRCAIRLLDCIPPFEPSVFIENNSNYYIRIFGSHSEAKREIKKWRAGWPDAKIVNEDDL